MEPETTVEGAPDLGAPEPAADAMFDGDERKCSGCGKTRPHTITRLNVAGRPVLCDGCHEETKR